VDDRVFVFIAKKAGYPGKDVLTRLRALQRQRAIDGHGDSLHDLALREQALDKDQQRRFERWARQIAARKSAEPLVESDDAPAKRRVIAEDSGRVAAEIDESRDDVDELIRRFAAASPAPPAAPTRAPTAAPSVKTPSAARLVTPTKGRVGRASRPTSPVQQAVALLAVTTALGAVAIAVASLSRPQPPPEEVASGTLPSAETKKPTATAPDALDPSRDDRGRDRPDPETPRDPSGRKALAQKLLAEAREFLARGQYDGARARAGQARSLDPSVDGLDEVEASIPARPSKDEGGSPGTSPSETSGVVQPLVPGADPLPKGPDARPDAGAVAKKPPIVPGQPYVEKFPDGKIKVRFETDMKGQRSGDYLENHPSGKPRIKAHYSGGELTGTFTEYFASGKTKRKEDYKKDQLHGHALEYDEKGKVQRDQVWFDGHLVFPRTQAEITATLAEIDASAVSDPAVPAQKTSFTPLDARAQTQGLRRLRGYRYLSNVPWDVGLSYEYGELCQAAARLLDLVGHLDHTPKRPAGASDELYEKGYLGTSQSNLHEEQGGTLVSAIDGFMDDSDPSNVDRVGHRRWCLDPPMKNTAFGAYANKWVAFYAFDKERADTKEPAFCPYPAPGYFPTTFIRGNAAWSCSLSDAHFSEPKPEEVTVKVAAADDRLKNGPPATIDSFTVNLGHFGMPWCVIFRPRVPFRAGARYSVEIKGLKDLDGKPAPILYWVEFFTP
jgi:hypothetical protein